MEFDVTKLAKLIQAMAAASYIPTSLRTISVSPAGDTSQVLVPKDA